MAVENWIQGIRVINALEKGMMSYDLIERQLSDAVRAASFQFVLQHRGERLRLINTPFALQQLALSPIGYALIPEAVRLAMCEDPIAAENLTNRLLTEAGSFDALLNDETTMEIIFSSYEATKSVIADPTIFAGVLQSPAALSALSRRAEGMTAMTESVDVAMPALASSVRAMDALSASATALTAIWLAQSAWGVVAANGMAVGKYVAGSAKLNPVSYADIEAVASSATAMSAVASSATAMSAVASSATAMSAVASSTIAMDAVGLSAIARDAVWQCQSAYETIAADGMAIGKYVAGCAKLNPATYANMAAVAASSTAMAAVAASSTAMAAVAASSTVMAAVAASAVAVRAVLNNKTSCWTMNASPHAASLAGKIQSSGLATYAFYNSNTPGSGGNTSVQNSNMPKGVYIVTSSSGEAFSHDKLEIAYSSGIKISGGASGKSGYDATSPQSVYIESSSRVIFACGGEYLYLHNDGSQPASHTLTRYY